MCLSHACSHSPSSCPCTGPGTNTGLLRQESWQRAGTRERYQRLSLLTRSQQSLFFPKSLSLNHLVIPDARQGFCFPRRSQAQAHRNPEKDPRQGTCCEWEHHLLTALNLAVQTPGMQAQVILTRKSIHRSPQLDRLSGGLLELQAMGYH